MCMAGTFTDKTFCLSLFTSNNPQTHLHSEGDGEIWRVKSGAGWQRERGAAFASEWNRSLVQVEGNERDLTTLGLAGITHGQNHNKGERELMADVWVCAIDVGRSLLCAYRVRVLESHTFFISSK